MKEYKKSIYKSYHSYHTKDLYGPTSLDKIKSQFPVYEYYFGKYLPADMNAKIIDLGCGSGELVYWLNTKHYGNVIGIDISKELINIGNALGISNLICGNIFDYLGENKGNYSLIIMRDVLEHFDREEVFTLIGLLYHNLEENGKVIIQVPNGQSPFVGKILFGDFTHNNAFTESSINQLVKAAGFTEVKVFEATPVPKNLKGMIRLILWNFLRFFIKTAQLIASGDSSGYFTQNIIAFIKK